MNIILIGAPGSGKGTLSSKLVEHGIVHLSTGDIFRKLSKSTGELSDRLKTYLNSGKLIPDDFTNEVAQKAIMEELAQNKSIVLDGYPRTIAQAQYLDKIIKVDQVFYLDIEFDVLVKRLTGRRTCEKCGKIYNIYFDSTKPKNNLVCDVCGGALMQRKDDNEATASVRIKTFEKDTMPLVEYYKDKKILTYLTSDNSIDQNVDVILKVLHEK